MEGPSIQIDAALELKTDKKAPATYRKKDDVGQAHDSLQWLKEEYKEYNAPSFFFVGPFGRCSKDAHPNDDMFLCSVARLCKLASDFVAVLDDLKVRIPLERAAQMRALRDRAEWKTEGIICGLQEFSMKTLKVEE